MQENPFRKIKIKFREEAILPRIIPRSDIEKLLNFMYKVKSKNEVNDLKILRDLVIVELFFATGARVYEIASLKKENIDLVSGTIRIMGKGRKERYIQIADSEVLLLVNQYYLKNKEKIDKNEWFFLNNRNGRFTEQSMRLMLKKYVKKSGIGLKITPHMFRHSLATYLIEEGVDITCVQKILGHSSIKTTQIYIYVAAKRQAEVLKEMHPRKKMLIKNIA